MDLDDDSGEIICYKKRPEEDNWKVALPETIVQDVVVWFHKVLGHPGQHRLQDTLNARYYHPKLRWHVDNLKCRDCQKHKLAGRGYGLLPKREVRVAPWEEVAVDLIGPWKVKVGSRLVEFNALTIIDTASNLVELVRIMNKTADHIRQKFAQTWLCRYPRPIRCVHNKDGNFTGSEFQLLLKMFGIKDVRLTSKTLSPTLFVNLCTRLSKIYYKF